MYNFNKLFGNIPHWKLTNDTYCYFIPKDSISVENVKIEFNKAKKVFQDNGPMITIVITTNSSKETYTTSLPSDININTMEANIVDGGVEVIVKKN